MKNEYSNIVAMSQLQGNPCQSKIHVLRRFCSAFGYKMDENSENILIKKMEN